MQDAILECEEHPGETMTVWLEGFDEAGDRMTTLVANTSVRFVLRRRRRGESYRGMIGAPTYSYDPPARKARVPRKAGG